MKKLFLIYGIFICSVFTYASYSGWNVYDSLKSGNWNPQQAQNSYRSGSSYHK